MSPMGILQDPPTDPRWYEENLNDFSLSSFLGHLDASCELNGKSNRPSGCVVSIWIYSDHQHQTLNIRIKFSGWR